MRYIFIFERKDGQDLEQYQQNLTVSDVDPDNCVNIAMNDHKGKEYFIEIPTQDFAEFVRQCQKMKAVLS